jgi:parallel beta-helix repeat protein
VYLLNYEYSVYWVKGAKEMRSIKLSGWFCLIIIMLTSLAWPGGAVGGVQPDELLDEFSTQIDSGWVEETAFIELEPPIKRKTIDRSSLNRALEDQIQAWLPAQEPHFTIVQPDLGVQEVGPSVRAATTCTVSSAADSGTGTLRECLQSAAAGDQILFDAAVFPPGAPTTITLTSSQLPNLTVNGLTIDASNAGVILDGSGLSGSPIGFTIYGAQDVTIRGFQIKNFYIGIMIRSGATNTIIGGDRSVGSGPLGQGNLISANSYVGVQIQNAGTTNNAIIGNFVGTNIPGDSANGNTSAGILIIGGASNNRVGGFHSAGVCDGDCNLISGNGVGVVIPTENTPGNQILGNFIGTNLSGNASLGTQSQGVMIGYGASQNVIGGSRTSYVCEGPCNLISGNVEIGVVLRETGTSENTILGNFIGTDASGTSAVVNGVSGVMIAFGASQNVVGGSHTPGTCDSACNVISGNFAGIQIQNMGSNSNEILGNFIGTNNLGNSALPNEAGVYILANAAHNQIGGPETGQRNLISGNTYSGLIVTGGGTNDNILVGNLIGTDISGTSAVPNDSGVSIFSGASNNRIGGTNLGEGNLISGNIDSGVLILDFGTDGNILLGNKVGTDMSGTSALPNYLGVSVGLGAAYTQVGGTQAGAGNMISGNLMFGLWIDSPETIGNQVQGNLIGTDHSGTVALPNYSGILISTGSTGNQIGGTTPGSGNLISGNLQDGICLQSHVAPGNIIAGNKIGTNLAGTAAIPNYYGVFLDRADGNMIGGTIAGANNLISGNTSVGLGMFNSHHNLVQGNKIGSDITGQGAIPNAVRGISIESGSSNNTIGGAEAGTGNLISGNGLVGVIIGHEASVGNRILGNRIGTNQDGDQALPNQFGVGIVQARETIIGGADTTTPWVCDGPCNLISGNTNQGILIQGVSAGETTSFSGRSDEESRTVQGNHVLGNFIGMNLAGTSDLPNQGFSVGLALEANGNLIGGNRLFGEGNLISGNNGGVQLFGLLTDDNQVSGNRIGTTADGNASLLNAYAGVYIHESASGNLVGGAEAGMGNLISGFDCEEEFGFRGIIITTYSGQPAVNNHVIGNLIGVNAAGSQAIPNRGGIHLDGLITGSVIRDNVISGNRTTGIYLHATTGILIKNNNIGLTADRSSPLPNGLCGVFLSEAPKNMVGPGNIIANHYYGVAIFYETSVGNTITQNSIYNVFGNADKHIGFFEMEAPLVDAPVLTGWDGSTLTGTACAECVVEVFANPNSEQSGRTYLGTTTAAGNGIFSYTAGMGYTYLTATATNGEGTTSEFSNSLQVGEDANFVYLPLILK